MSMGSKDLSESFLDFLTGLAKAVLGLGALCSAAAAGLLVFMCFKFSGSGSTEGATQALSNIDIFQRMLVGGVVAVAVGSGYLWWGEDLPPGILTLLAAALYFAPNYLPSLLNAQTATEPVSRSYGALQMGGMALGALSLLTLFVGVGIRIKDRVRVGVKADQLKYGKGAKEEPDRQNVFMGNCWQLPYCRKFVRERCPIFHAKRTCWRERTGCMCEEEVIRNAMENKPIPKDAVLAAKMIPRNHRLNEQQKVERCKNCVIYNEHQRHKYKLLLPITVTSFLLLYVAMHGMLVGMMLGFVTRAGAVINSATMTSVSKGQDAPTFFVEAMLFVFMLMALTYALKLLEFVVFKLKI